MSPILSSNFLPAAALDELRGPRETPLVGLDGYGEAREPGRVGKRCRRLGATGIEKRSGPVSVCPRFPYYVLRSWVALPALRQPQDVPLRWV